VMNVISRATSCVASVSRCRGDSITVLTAIRAFVRIIEGPILDNE